MWSSWVKEKGTTHVMYITKLKDSPKKVNKTFSMILERVFEMVWWKGEKIESHQKGFLKLKCFSPQKILTSPLFEETLLAFLSLPIFFLLNLLSTWGFWWYLRRKLFLQKLLLKWLQYTGGGRIFWNGVMHANMAKPWIWRWGSCGYIGGGCIFQSGVMHANIFGRDLQIMWVANHFQKKIQNSNGHTP
jgi:hypothetical protein